MPRWGEGLGVRGFAASTKADAFLSRRAGCPTPHPRPLSPRGKGRNTSNQSQTESLPGKGTCAVHGPAVSDPSQTKGQSRPTRHRFVRGRNDAGRSNERVLRLVRFHVGCQDRNGAFFRKSGKVIIPLTVKEILNEEIAMKLASQRIVRTVPNFAGCCY